MPGKPQVWYLDLFAGKNDYEAMERAGAGGHKEINRTNLSQEDMAAGLQRPVVRRQLELLKMRASYPVFDSGAAITASAEGSRLHFTWEKDGQRASLDADLTTCGFTISITDASGACCTRWSNNQNPVFSRRNGADTIVFALFAFTRLPEFF